MTALQSLLADPATAGVWNLVPARSSVRFRNKTLWGLVPVNGEFTDVSGDGQITAKGAVFGRVDVRAASVGPESRSATSTCAPRLLRRRNAPRDQRRRHRRDTHREGTADLRTELTVRETPARCRCRPPSSTPVTARCGYRRRPRWIGPRSASAATWPA